MKVAALDLGSNTFLCLIAEVQGGAIEKTYYDEVHMVRLGQGLAQAKRFHPEALERADNSLKKFSAAISSEKPERILAMATSAARDAENKEELFALANKYGIPLEIIPGDKEAQITYEGAVSAEINKSKNRLVVDIGGGSTEFIYGCGNKLMGGKSYDIGCVRLTERFVTSNPVSEKELSELTVFLNSAILGFKETIPADFQIDEILAVAGTPTALVEAELGRFDPNIIDGYKLDRSRLSSWVARLSQSTVQEKINMGIHPGRADVILVGAVTLLECLDIFEMNHIVVSTRGVRYGVALEAARR